MPAPALGGGEFTLWLIPHKKVAPSLLEVRHTHTHSGTTDCKCHLSSPPIWYFPMKEFKDQELTMVKTLPMLKTFIYSAYGQCLVAAETQDTSGQQGCAPSHNMYNILSNHNGNTDTDDDATAKKITQTAAAAETGSTLGTTYAHMHIPVHSKVSTAINHFLANQAALYQQMAALSFHAPSQRNNMFQIPPIETLTILGIRPPFAIGVVTSGRSVRGSRRCECGYGEVDAGIHYLQIIWLAVGVGVSLAAPAVVFHLFNRGMHSHRWEGTGWTPLTPIS